MKKFSSILLIFLILASPTRAVVISSLYKGIISTDNYSDTTRTQTIKKALTQVLIKVSGNPQIATIPQIQDTIAKANLLVDSYSYNKQEQQFVAQFNPNTILQVLRNAKQAIWGKNRPEIMIWLTITPSTGNSTIISNEDNIASLVQNAAQQRGLPVLFPMLDITDLTKINAANIHSFNFPSIMQASSRYHTKIILVGNLIQTGENSWNSSWQLLLNGSTIAWQTTAKDLQNSINTIIDNTTNQLATTFSSLSNSTLNKVLLIKIVGAHDLDTDLELIKYLENFNSISKVTLFKIAPDSITLKITTSTDKKTLMKHIQQKLNLNNPQNKQPTQDSTT